MEHRLEQLTTILILLFAVVLSRMTSAMARIPLPLVQIAFGVVLAELGVRSALEPSVFLLLFIAPLLFIEAYRFPRVEFLSLRRPILQMAIGLVIFTVISAGYFIRWIIPNVPLAACFALASVLSPTDAVAVASSTRGVKIPSRLMHLLEGEALLNDATGLVCFRFAIAAAVTGTFSVRAASLSFLEVSLGGAAVGFVIAFLVLRGDQRTERIIGAHPATSILIFLLIPFGAYLAAEHLHFSGILAVVAAGFAGNWILQDVHEAELRIKSAAIIEMVEFTLNGLIFLLLGLQLPEIGRRVPDILTQEQFGSPWLLAGFAIAIAVCLGVLRFIWGWFAFRWTFRRDRQTGLRRTPPKRLLAVVSLAGVRGAVTLAAALSIPALLANGRPFPGRDLTILLAGLVILLSLLVASFGLPFVMQGVEEPPEVSEETQRRRARIAAAEAAIRHLEQVENDPGEYAELHGGLEAITGRLVDYYRRRIEALSGSSPNQAEADALRTAERKVRLEALRAERSAINRLVDERAVDAKVVGRILAKLDTTEASLQND